MPNRRRFISDLSILLAAAGVNVKSEWIPASLLGSSSQAGASPLPALSKASPFAGPVVITETSLQSGMVFAANVLKFYFAEHGYDHLCLNMSSLQPRTELNGLKEFREWSPSNGIGERTFISAGAFSVPRFESLLDEASLLFVVDSPDLHESLWRHVISQRIGAWSMPLSASPLDFSPGQFVVTRADVARFASFRRVARERSSNPRAVVIKPSPSTDFNEACKSLFEQTGLSDWESVAERVSRAGIYGDMRFVKPPEASIANREEAVLWLNEAEAARNLRVLG